MRLLSRLQALICLLTLLLPMGFAASAADRTEKYCQPDGANILVYVDRTTPYDEIDKSALVDGISRIFESLTGGERFTVRTIADATSHSETLLSACIPVCASKGLIDDLFRSDCTEGAAINDRQHLRSQIVTQLRQLLDGFVELPYSAIAGTLAETGSLEYRRGRSNRIFIFSDLIENSPDIPGKDLFDSKAPILVERAEKRRMIPDLAEADVRVFGVGRSGKPGRPPLPTELLLKLKDFWEAYFAKTGANLTIGQSLGDVN